MFCDRVHTCSCISPLLCLFIRFWVSHENLREGHWLLIVSRGRLGIQNFSSATKIADRLFNRRLSTILNNLCNSFCRLFWVTCAWSFLWDGRLWVSGAEQLKDDPAQDLDLGNTGPINHHYRRPRRPSNPMAQPRASCGTGQGRGSKRPAGDPKKGPGGPRGPTRRPIQRTGAGYRLPVKPKVQS